MKISGHLQIKKGYYYAVLNWKDERGKRRTKWMATGLTVKDNKRKAEAFLAQAKTTFVAPKEAAAAKQMVMADMLFADYMLHYLSVLKKRKIADNTYAGYNVNIKAIIEPYFRKLGITLGELEAEDIQDFYDKQLERVKAMTVIHYHAILHLAVTHARKEGYIPENPMDMVDKPKKDAFVGKIYDKDEYNAALQAAKDTKLELPVLFGGVYGLRRSEIVGLRWSAIDFKNNVFHINHTVTIAKIDGTTKICAKDRAKTKSSLRTLPLTPPVKERLLELKARQEEYQRKFKRSYNKQWLDYILVDELGELILPNYITPAWVKFLERNNFRRIRFHDLRHTCASFLLNDGKDNGVTLKHIQDWLGHSDYSTTANIYSHLDNSAKACSADTMMSVVDFAAYCG